MARSNVSFFILLFTTVCSIGYFCLLKISPGNGIVAGTTTSDESVMVSFFFGGGGQFTLYGYTSPNALVDMESSSGYDETRADDKGYYEFRNRYSPVSPLEVCLTAQDQFGRTSNPVCLPSFPNNSYITIGPVVLSPTLSFDKSDYYIGDEVVLSGQTIPNTDVSLEMFTQDTKNSKLESRFSFIKPVEAFSFPNLTTKSDSFGNFAISLPSASAKTYRLFAQANYNEQNSPKSLTLQFKILPVWMIIIKFFLFIWSLIKSRLLEIIILGQIIILIYYFLNHYFEPRAIVVWKHKELTLEKHELAKREKYLPIVK